MNASIKQALKRAVCGAVLAGSLLAIPASAQVVVEFPPPEFIAVNPPVYFEGHAAYYYGNRWYYRDGPGWHSYHDEPLYLRNWRGGHAGFGEHRYYEGRRGGGGWGGRGERRR